MNTREKTCCAFFYQEAPVAEFDEGIDSIKTSKQSLCQDSVRQGFLPFSSFFIPFLGGYMIIGRLRSRRGNAPDSVRYILFGLFLFLLFCLRREQRLLSGACFRALFDDLWHTFRRDVNAASHRDGGKEKEVVERWRKGGASRNSDMSNVGILRDRGLRVKPTVFLTQYE